MYSSAIPMAFMPYMAITQNNNYLIWQLHRVQLFWLMEQVVLLLLSQAVRYLIDPTVDGRDKQLLKRELSSEMVS